MAFVTNKEVYLKNMMFIFLPIESLSKTGNKNREMVQ